MLQQSRRFRLPMIGAILLGLLVGAYLFAAKRVAKQEPTPAISKHTVGTNPEDALKYWTEEKMRSAKPAKMPKVKNVKPLEGRKKRSKRPPV